MNREVFWTIVEKAKDTDTEIMYSNLLSEMVKLPKKDVGIFRAFVAGYERLIDKTVWLDMACKVINGYVSDGKGFDQTIHLNRSQNDPIYINRNFRLWLISCGETVLLRALKNPDTLSELPEIPFGNAKFAMLMEIGIDEKEKKCAKLATETSDYKATMMYLKLLTLFNDNVEDAIKEIPEINFKDGTQFGKYKSFEAGMADIPNILPNLVKRAELEQFDWKNYAGK
jgi:hypothetical protein